MFNINRDPKKSQVLHASEIAPDLFGKHNPHKQAEQDERALLENVGEQLLGGFSGFGNAG